MSLSAIVLPLFVHISSQQFQKPNVESNSIGGAIAADSESKISSTNSIASSNNLLKLQMAKMIEQHDWLAKALLFHRERVAFPMKANGALNVHFK